MDRTTRHEVPFRALFIAAVYLVVSLLWILFSDRLVFALFEDHETLNRISSIKGYGFVFASSLLILGLTWQALNRLKSANGRLADSLDAETALREEVQMQFNELETAREQLERKNEALMQYQKAMRAMLYKDDWTSLPNRRALRGFLERHAASPHLRPLTLLYMDLDNFKLINDVYGHSRGDAYIRTVAENLRSRMGNAWVLYRMGGDEFVFCHQGPLSDMELSEATGQLLDVFSTPLSVDGASIHGSVSFGVARFPEHGTSAEDLLRNADIAMFRAKQSGRGRCVVFNMDMQEHVSRRFHIESALRDALADDEFSLLFQPQYELLTGRVSGFEALLRWRSAKLGAVPVSEFIPIAEESRHILPIGAWVLDSACRFLRRLHDTGRRDLSMAVNISMLQLVQDDFVDLAIRTAERNGVPNDKVELEITESILMQSRSQVVPVLQRLRAAGFRISLDDFGQGYSSLSYLMAMPISVLKIDKLFIDAIGNEGPGGPVLKTILELARRLRLRTVAEGVETAEQKEFLLANGCDRLQGYWFSRPIAEDAAIELLDNHPVQRM